LPIGLHLAALARVCLIGRNRKEVAMNTKILALVGLLTLAACGGAREPPAAVTAAAPAAGISAEMAWARAALDRNPEFEVLATDTAAGVFTIRNRASGEVRTVKLADLALAPAGSPEAPANESVAVDAEAASVADESVSSDTQALPTDAEPALDYKVERSGGQVRVSGPGVSIVSATGPAAATAAAESGPRTVDPIICDGERVLQVNGRRVVVTGNAITAKNGCQLHIINSRITATGTGVVIQDATVHITNSTIEGGTASFDAGPGAKVFLQGATMKGATRRDERAEVHEQGNNQWH
jgi:hypothetical protein